MPLSRYQIRNEYSLADPELYRAADKDDPEALLEGVAMAGLVGVLRQLGDLAEFAAELFHDLHEEVMATSARGHGLMNRLQQIEAEFPSIEKTLLSRTSHSEFLYNAGVDWHPNLPMDQNLIARGDLPRFVMDSYEECRGPPRLFLLDKFDIAGAGACLKRYTDPSFFKPEITSSETAQTENQREKKARKIKKKASRGRNGEISEGVSSSHSKLHQLLSMEHSQTENSAPMHRVKLKRRQSNCSLVDSTSGRSYMERFVGTCSPESKFPYESSVSPLRLKMESSNSGELVLEIREIRARSPENKFGERDIRAAQSPIMQGKILEQSLDELGEDVTEEGILMLAESTPDNKLESIPSTLHKVEEKKELMVDEDSNTEASTYGCRSDDVASEIDKYVDALATVESEMEIDTENRPKNEIGFRNIGEKGEDSCTNEGQHKLQAQFSDSHRSGNSIASDDGNNSFAQERFRLSYSNTPSNLTENVSSDGNAAAEVHPSTEVFSDEIVDMCSGKHSDNGDVIKHRSPEGVVHSGTHRQVSDQNYSLEFGKASCEISNLSPGESLSKPQFAVLDLIGVSSGYIEAVNVGSSSDADDDEKSSGGAMPCLTNISDLPTQLRDDVIPLKCQTVEMLDDRNPDVSYEALMHPCNVLDLDSGKKNDDDDASQEMLPTKVTEDSTIGSLLNELDIPDSVILPTEAQCFQEQDLVACSATSQPECLPKAFTHDDMAGMKPHSIIEETENVISSTGEKSEHLSSVVTDELKLLKTTYKVPRGEQESTSDGIDCPEMETSNNYLVVLPNRSACDVVVLPNSDAPLDSPFRYINSGTTESGSGMEVHSQLATLGSGAFHTEAANEDKIIGHKAIGSSSGGYVMLQNECHSNWDSDQNGLKSSKASIHSHLIGSSYQKGSVDGPTGFIQELSNSESSKASGSELSHDVHNNPPLPEPAENLLNLSDGSNGLSTSRESDQELELKQPPQSHLSDSAEETTPSSIHPILELEALSDRGLEVTADLIGVCFLPPENPNLIDLDGSNTPSKYISMDPLSQPSEPKFSLLPSNHKLENSEPFVRPSSCPEATEHQPLDSRPNTPVLEFPLADSNALQDSKEEMLSRPPLPPMQRRVGKRQRGSVTSEGEVFQPSFNPFWQLSPATTKEGRQGFPTLEGGSAQYVNPFLPLPTTDDEKPQQGPQMLGGEFVQPYTDASLTSEKEMEQMVQPPSSFTSPSIEDDKHGSLSLEEETTNAEDGKPNGFRRTKIPRPRDPLIEAVASHDKSRLRKVSERARPQLEPKVEERNSLLEQIRNKSFNLKPAVATRPSIHGPRTNLKVVAILEKANAIRQALAGSDDDEDEDSWSDS